VGLDRYAHRNENFVLVCIAESGGGFEADGLQQLIQIIDDTLIEAIQLRAFLLLKFGITLDRLQETSGERRLDSLKELEENEAHGVALGGQAMAAGFGDFERQAFGAQLGQVVAQRGQAVLV